MTPTHGQKPHTLNFSEAFSADNQELLNILSFMSGVGQNIVLHPSLVTGDPPPPHTPFKFLTCKFIQLHFTYSSLNIVLFKHKVALS